MEDPNISPGGRRCRRDRARYAVMSPIARATINKTGCDFATTKRLLNPPPQKKLKTLEEMK